MPATEAVAELIDAGASNEEKKKAMREISSRRSRVDHVQAEAERRGVTTYLLGFIGGRLIAGETVTIETLEAALDASKELVRRANRVGQ